MSNRPTTLGEARKYRYGKWAGNPEGNPYQEGRCIQEIFPNGRGAMHRQCGMRGVPYCQIHTPSAQEERAAKQRARFRGEMAAIDRREKERRDMRRFKLALEKIAATACLCDFLGCVHDTARKALRGAVKEGK